MHGGRTIDRTHSMTSLSNNNGENKKISCRWAGSILHELDGKRFRCFVHREERLPPVLVQGLIRGLTPRVPLFIREGNSRRAVTEITLTK